MEKDISISEVSIDVVYSSEKGQAEEQTPGEPAVVEVVDMRIEAVQYRKHLRIMERTIRWPIHSNTPRITF